MKATRLLNDNRAQATYPLPPGWLTLLAIIGLFILANVVITLV